MSRAAALAPSAPVGVPDYTERLRTDWEWKMDEADRHFRGGGTVREALQAITSRLKQLGIPYAVVGGMAVVRHGLNRFTDDVDLLVTREGWEAIHQNLRGRGYLPPFEASKNLKDTSRGVRIEFLITGQYPGSGKEQPVSFPDPTDVGEEIDGVTYLNLPTLITLKLASWMSAKARAKDAGDVQELIRTHGLTAEYADQLHPYVRDAFREQCEGVEEDRRSGG
ncbi:nucleotidyl transferase AbiEii/AbiGii toxin family protein [Alienimonas californiensis]|uniref:Uncharacterized protein n=1 Tax=Alienimonas californiensis TaxID=2527989 RepID=A0A517P7P5_9PLAN|nr:nucleotidyl transferase AbiEii/AbiGii toxin family protein [Alienimonas californiensis]QDT15390.1 hypothetical protein CA12_14750 [Alienimonas californiensis]